MFSQTIRVSVHTRETLADFLVISSPVWKASLERERDEGLSKKRKPGPQPRSGLARITRASFWLGSCRGSQQSNSYGSLSLKLDFECGSIRMLLTVHCRSEEHMAKAGHEYPYWPGRRIAPSWARKSPRQDASQPQPQPQPQAQAQASPSQHNEPLELVTGDQKLLSRCPRRHSCQYCEDDLIDALTAKTAYPPAFLRNRDGAVRAAKNGCALYEWLLLYFYRSCAPSHHGFYLQRTSLELFHDVSSVQFLIGTPHYTWPCATFEVLTEAG